MKSDITKLMEIIKRLPEKAVKDLLEEAEKIKEECDKEEDESIPKCPHCKETHVVKNGLSKGKQTYLCRSCKKKFTETTGTVMENSHSGEAVWKEVIRNTIDGVPLATTAKNLDIHHETAFNMRHKILRCLEQEQAQNPLQIAGVCEADETYLLENFKGKKLPEDFHRKARKHGAVASKPGISNEYICICTAAVRGGGTMAIPVCKSQPTSENISSVFADKVTPDALIVCDGAKAYNTLEKNGNCAVIHIEEGAEGFKNINVVNGYHSFIKERNRQARGFATKYLGRYSALFSLAYNINDFIVDDIYKMMCDMNNRYNTIADSQSQNLFNLV